MSDLIKEAKARIKQVRRKKVRIEVKNGDRSIEGAEVCIRMREHQFLFGAVSYAHGTLGLPGKEERFTESFRRLLNYTMVPYHWSWYEPEQDVYNEPYTGNLVRWADANGLKKKLHALIWHELCPDWITDQNVEEQMAKRLNHLMETYGDSFDFFDLANETTVNDRFDNPVSRWIKRIGPFEMMKFGSKIVRHWRPDAKLLYGDWNVHGEDYFEFLSGMRENNIDIDIIGLQSHMHRDLWSQEETLRVIDRTAAFGWPIHFPECSLISGKPIGEMSYEAGAVNHFTETEEDAYKQAELARDFYTIVFSHPAVEALSWFDFTDHRWLGAPAGLVDDDLNPKPVYGALFDLIHREWHSDHDMTTGTDGSANALLFCGNYDITIRSGDMQIMINRDILRDSFYEGGGDAERIVVDLATIKNHDMIVVR